MYVARTIRMIHQDFKFSVGIGYFCKHNQPKKLVAPLRLAVLLPNIWKEMKKKRLGSSNHKLRHMLVSIPNPYPLFWVSGNSCVTFVSRMTFAGLA